MTWRQYGGSFDNPINPEYEQEARLVEQSRAGSERAFSALLARYQQPVFRLILYLVGDEDEARELTRISIKNALLHMPSVPSGYSIRPWLLRVAVLVALDSVRERGQTPEDLLTGLQLPAPAGPPRIVDADPADSETMILGVAQMDAARQRETALADPWDELPLDVERELIRLLLAGLPEGDAELLALGVVGQVPTRDLSALAGTSQRSVRRRIARALILFQSRYNTVRHDGLPAASREDQLPPVAPSTRELPPSKVTATPSSPLVERARKGIADATDLVRRGIQSVRQGMGVSDAEDRLRTLRTGEVPPADIVPPSPDIPAAADFDSSAAYQPFSQADAETPETSPLSGELPEDLPPGTFDPQSQVGWTTPVTSRDAAEHDTIPAPPLSDIPERDTMPPAGYDATQPVDLPGTAQMSIPASGTDEATVIRPLDPSISSPGRHLPRFGPPPEDVLVGMPATVVPDSSPSDIAEPAIPPEEDATVEAAEPPSTPAPVEATIPRSGRWDDVTLLKTPPPPVEPEAFTEPETVAASEAVAEPEVPVEPETVAEPEAPVELETVEDSSLVEASAADAAIVDAEEAAPVAEETAELTGEDRDDDTTAPPDAAPGDEVAPLEVVDMRGGTDLADVPSAALLSDHEEPEHIAESVSEPMPVTEQPAVSEEEEELPGDQVMASAQEPVTQEDDDMPSGANDAGEAPPVETPPPADSPAISAIERAQGTDARPQHPVTGLLGNTSVVPPSSRTDYMSRHRPPWLDAGDVGSIPGVQIDPAAGPEDEPLPLAPTAPASGALTLPAHEVASPETTDVTEADAAPDMADLADLTDLPTEDDASDAPDSPGDSQAPKRLRTPSRPMPKLERDIIDPPQER